MTYPADETALETFTRLARQCTALVKSYRLPESPVEYFRENAPYVDIAPLEGFLGAGDKLRKLFWACQDNAENPQWDSDQEDQMSERIAKAHERLRFWSEGMDRYSDLWTRIEICQQFAPEQADEVIRQARNVTPPSPA